MLHTSSSEPLAFQGIYGEDIDSYRREYTGQVKLKAEQGASSISRFLRHGSLSQGQESVPVSTPINSAFPSAPECWVDLLPIRWWRWFGASGMTRISTRHPLYSILYYYVLSFLFTLLRCTDVNHLQGLQYDALTHPEARNVHVCVCPLQLMWMISINSPYSFHMVSRVFLVRISFCHFVYTVRTQYAISGPRGSRQPQNAIYLTTTTTTRSHERMNSPHTPYNLPLPSPLSNPLSHWWLVNPGRTWSWMHHIHIPPVWNLQKQVGSPSFRHPSRSLRGQ